MTSSPAPVPTSIIPQSKNGGRSSATTFGCLPRELRDIIYGYIVTADEGVVAVSACATDYGTNKEIEAIRTILHASGSTTQFAREAYEIFFLRTTFQIESTNLLGFVNRKTHHLRNEGFFDVKAWIGSLEVTVYKPCYQPSTRLEVIVNNLRALLVCPRLHTMRVQIKESPLTTEEDLNAFLRTIAEVSAQLRGKIGNGFKVETDGRDKWGNEIRKQLSPWILSPAESTRRESSSN